MSAPTARAIYDAAEQAIYDLVVSGKSEARVLDKSYKANQLSELERVRDYYKAQAVSTGEIPTNSAAQVIQVSAACITEN